MNKITHCKLNKNDQKKLLEFFVLEVIARSAADVLEIHPNTAALFYKKIRQVITYHLQHENAEMFDGCVELDESYFGGKRKGKRGRGVAGKVAVFGILKRHDKVYTAVVDNTRTKTLMPMLPKKRREASVMGVFMKIYPVMGREHHGRTEVTGCAH